MAINKLIKIIFIFMMLLSQNSRYVQAETHILNFGIYGSERRSWLEEHNAPILQHIEKKFKTKFKHDVQINTVFFPSYTDAVNALIAKQIDFARLGAASYIKVKRKAPLVSIIAVESYKGKQYHEGVIAVLKDSPIKAMEDLKNKSFAFGNESSTIGRYLSQQYLLDNGITSSDLKDIEYMGRHDNVAVAVIRKVHDAGAFKIGILKKEQFRQRLRILGRFKAPTQAWVAREGIETSLLKSLKKIFLKTPKNVIYIKNRDAFVEGSDNRFTYLRKSIEENEAFFTKNRN